METVSMVLLFAESILKIIPVKLNVPVTVFPVALVEVTVALPVSVFSCGTQAVSPFLNVVSTAY